MAKVQIYGFPISGPCRNVFLVLDVLDIPYEIIETVPYKGDCDNDEFRQLNPQMMIPVYKDGDFVLSECRAIMMYLASKHGNTKLYPSDLKQRAAVDKMLFYDMDSFAKSVNTIAFQVLGLGKRPTDKQLDDVKKNLIWLNGFLKPTGYSAGTTHMTLADLAHLVAYTTLVAMDLIDVSPYKEVSAWYEKVKAQIPHYDKVNGDCAKGLGDLFNQKLKDVDG